MFLLNSFLPAMMHFAPDGGGGNNDTDPDSDNGRQTDSPTAPGGRLDPERLKAKHGDAEAALRALAFKLDDVEADNARYRQQLKDLKGKAPGEDAVILDSEQAAAWQAYQELGEPDELQQLKGDYTQLQRSALYRQAGEAHGYKPAVLGQLPGISELSIEVKEIEQDGEKAKVAYVKNGDDGQERPLPDYVKDTWADFLPALQAQPQQTGAGTPWPKQDVASQGADTDPVQARLEAHREANKERKNPLMK